jgi:hypothetical protein
MGISVPMGYGLDDQGSILGRGKISFVSVASRLALEPTQPPVQWLAAAVSPRVKRQGREADHSSLSTEVKKGGAVPPHTSLWRDD